MPKTPNDMSAAAKVRRVVLGKEMRAIEAKKAAKVAAAKAGKKKSVHA